MMKYPIYLNVQNKSLHSCRTCSDTRFKLWLFVHNEQTKNFDLILCTKKHNSNTDIRTYATQKKCNGLFCIAVLVIKI